MSNDTQVLTPSWKDYTIALRIKGSAGSNNHPIPLLAAADDEDRYVLGNDFDLLVSQKKRSPGSWL